MKWYEREIDKRNCYLATDDTLGVLDMDALGFFG